MYQGIVFAADQGAVAANISYAYYNGDAFSDAAQYMFSKGGWVTVAGGNYGEPREEKDNPLPDGMSIKSK